MVQNRKHDRDVIDNGRENPDQDIGRQRPHAGIHGLGSHEQITELSQTADTQNNAVEKQQRIPLGPGNLAEQIKTVVILFTRHIQRTV